MIPSILWDAAAASGTFFKISLIFFRNSFLTDASVPAMMQFEDGPKIGTIVSHSLEGSWTSRATMASTQADAVLYDDRFAVDACAEVVKRRESKRGR
jgi:hypothetical protein